MYNIHPDSNSFTCIYSYNYNNINILGIFSLKYLEILKCKKQKPEYNNCISKREQISIAH